MGSRVGWSLLQVRRKRDVSYYSIKATPRITAKKNMDKNEGGEMKARSDENRTSTRRGRGKETDVRSISMRRKM